MREIWIAHDFLTAGLPPTKMCPEKEARFAQTRTILAISAN